MNVFIHFTYKWKMKQYRIRLFTLIRLIKINEGTPSTTCKIRRYLGIAGKLLCSIKKNLLNAKWMKAFQNWGFLMKNIIWFSQASITAASLKTYYPRAVETGYIIILIINFWIWSYWIKIILVCISFTKCSLLNGANYSHSQDIPFMALRHCVWLWSVILITVYFVSDCLNVMRKIKINDRTCSQ